MQQLLLKVCEALLLRQNEKACSILWSGAVFLAFLEKRRAKKTLFVYRSKFRFPYLDA